MENRNFNILHVDDEDSIRDLLPFALRFYLDTSTINFHGASSGNEAIKLISQGKKFDLVISDYSMSDGTGAELLRYFHKKNIDVPTVLFTSSSKPELPYLSPKFLGIVEKMELRMLSDKIAQVYPGCSEAEYGVQ